MPTGKSNKVTLENLARMVSKGFNNAGEKMDKGFKEVNVRLDRIENSILKHHSQQILMLEKRMQRMENMLTIK